MQGYYYEVLLFERRRDSSQPQDPGNRIERVQLPNKFDLNTIAKRGIFKSCFAEYVVVRNNPEGTQPQRIVQL